MAIAARFCLGLFNPVTGLIKTVVAELCCDKHQAFAMSVVSASWSVGLVIGPAVGGYTARPAQQYPNSLLGSLTLFQMFPYLLPNLITAVLSIVSMGMIFLFLPETLHVAHVDTLKSYEMVRVTESEEMEEEGVGGRRELGVFVEEEEDEEQGSLLAGESKSTARDSPPVCTGMANGGVTTEQDGFVASFMLLLRIEAVRVSVLAYVIISYIAIVYDELLPLWALSEQRKGAVYIALSCCCGVLSQFRVCSSTSLLALACVNSNTCLTHCAMSSHLVDVLSCLLPSCAACTRRPGLLQSTDRPAHQPHRYPHDSLHHLHLPLAFQQPRPHSVLPLRAAVVCALCPGGGVHSSAEALRVARHASLRRGATLLIVC